MSTGLGYWDCPGCGARVTLAWTVCACGTSLLAMPRLAALAVPSHRLGPGPKPPDPPRLTGKVLGFRQWALDGYMLRSAVKPAAWRIGVNEARCLRGLPGGLPQHDAPHPRCECGLYAWHEPVVIDHGASVYGYGASVYGAVLAWGRIEVHSDGFRAQYAEPVMLAYSREQRYALVEDARTIAGEMGIPLVELSELEARARELGSPIAPELRPPAVPRLTPPSFASASIGVPAPLFAPVATAAPISFQISTTVTPLPRPRARRVNRLIGLGNAGAAGANLAYFAFAGQHVANLIAGILTAVLAALLLRRAARS